MLLTAIQGRTPAIPLPLLQRTTLCTAVRSGSRLSMEQSSKIGEAIVPRNGGHAFEQGHQPPEILDGYLPPLWVVRSRRWYRKSQVAHIPCVSVRHKNEVLPRQAGWMED